MIKNTFYITTPIFYASGNLHLGHVYTAIACDILARWNRNIGKEVFFLSGSDEHGQKIDKQARQNNLEPQEFVDMIVSGFKDTLSNFNISNDYFIRTTDEKHKKIVQKMLQKVYDNGDIYKDSYEGLYCVDCEMYYKAEELIDEKICPVHKREVLFMKEENYFFRLSKYQDKLLKLYEDNKDFLSPHSKAQETINRVKEGLEDISISRNKKTLSWGIELPFDKDHVSYVWFDALFNYISALEIKGVFEKFWPADVHVVGKDIMWFHKVCWPAFLMSAGYKIPKKIFAHGWWTVDGEKMGKSMGNVIDPVEVSLKYGIDEFRYYVLSVGAFGDDLDFSHKTFVEKINNELNNDLGNLVSRVHTMTQKYFEGIVPDAGIFSDEDERYLLKLNIFDKFDEDMQQFKFNHALEILWTAIRETNAYINKVAPWKEQDEKRLATIINILVSSVRMFGEYIDCFMPHKVERLRKQYDFKKEGRFVFEVVKDGHKLGEKDNLFEKVSTEEKKENIIQKREQIKRVGFSSLNLKVGKIISARQHPEAEKLYIEEIDLGEEKPRQIVSGLKGFYELSEMIGKKVVVVANLKPAKLRGVKSEGMVLVSESKDESCIGFLESDAEIGTNLVCGQEIADNSLRIIIEDFFKIKMTSDGEKVYLEKADKRVEIRASNKRLGVDRNVKGRVC